MYCITGAITLTLVNLLAAQDPDRALGQLSQLLFEAACLINGLGGAQLALDVCARSRTHCYRGVKEKESIARPCQLLQ